MGVCGGVCSCGEGVGTLGDQSRVSSSLYTSSFFFMGVGGWAGSFLNLELKIRSCSDPPASAHSVLGGAEGVGERYA